MRFSSAVTAAAFLVAITGVASAEPRYLAATPLGSSRCKAIATTKTDEAGEKLPRRQWYPSGWRCPGHAGRFVYLAYDDQREGIAFGTAAQVATEYIWPAGFGSWGPAVEWRGDKGVTAAIARYSWSISHGDAGAAEVKGSDLAVIKVGRAGSDTCILAWIDATANTDALELARRHADTAAPGATCKPDHKPARLGKLSAGRAE